MISTGDDPEADDDPAAAIDRHRVRIDETRRRLSSGAVPDERVPTAVHDLAVAHDAVARSHAVLGDAASARAAYAGAAVYYLSSVHESRKRSGMFRPRERYDDPATCVTAITRALLSGEDALRSCAARETAAMGQRTLREHDNRSYYGAKLLAAVVLGEDHGTFADEYRHSTRAGDDESPLLAYEGIAEGDAAKVVEGLQGMIDRASAHAKNRAAGPGGASDDWAGGLCLLARDRGLDVGVDAPTVPDALVPGAEAAHVVHGEEERATEDTTDADGTDDDGGPRVRGRTGGETRTGADADRASVEAADTRGEAEDDTAEEDTRTGADAEASGEGDAGRFPRVEPDPDTGGCVLVARVEAPEDGVVTYADLPETDRGRLFSEAWVGAVVDDLGPVEGTDPAVAHRRGELRRRLVVVAPAGCRVDASVFDAGVDAVEVTG